MGVARVIFNGKTIIDVMSDTVTKEKLLVNETAHDSAGNVIVGTAVPRGDGRFSVDQDGIAHIKNFNNVIISGQ